MLGWSDEQDVDNYGNLYNNPINTGNYGNDSIHSHKGPCWCSTMTAVDFFWMTGQP